MVTVDDIRAYMDGPSQTDAQIQDALDAETLAQARACVVPADPDDMPADLAEALKRRVQRNLEMRGQPFVVTPDDNGNVSIVPSRDPEVRRLEAGHRRLVMG